MGLEIRLEITSLEWNGFGWRDLFGGEPSSRSCLKKAEILMAARNVIK